MKITENTAYDNKGIPHIRFTLNITLGEGLLLKEAVDCLLANNAAPGLWDCYNDPIVASQMSRRLEAIK